MPNPIARRWPEATIVVAASGPSLTREQLAEVRAAGVPLVVVNDAVRLAPWADVLYSSDQRWYAQYRGVPAFACARVGVGYKKGDASPFTCPGGVVVDVLAHTGAEGLEAAPTGLRTGYHSGYAAINLAVHLGARRIVLIGYTLGARGRRAHFFGNHPPTLGHTTEAQYERFRRVYGTLAPALTARRIAVVNATPDTCLAIFPRAPLGEALALCPATLEGAPC